MLVYDKDYEFIEQAPRVSSRGVAVVQAEPLPTTPEGVLSRARFDFGRAGSSLDRFGDRVGVSKELAARMEQFRRYSGIGIVARRAAELSVEFDDLVHGRHAEATEPLLATEPAATGADLTPGASDLGQDTRPVLVPTVGSQIPTGAAALRPSLPRHDAFSNLQ